MADLQITEERINDGESLEEVLHKTRILSFITTIQFHHLCQNQPKSIVHSFSITIHFSNQYTNPDKTNTISFSITIHFP